VLGQCCETRRSLLRKLERQRCGNKLSGWRIYGGLGCVHFVAVEQPIGPLWAYLTWQFVTASQFSRVVSTVPIKATGGSRR
jgi:hypothetical protein